MAKTDNLTAEVNDVMKRLNKSLKGVRGKEKKAITDKAGLHVAIKARRLAPVGKARGGVLKGAASATYKNGKISARYYPLNLKRSLNVLKLRKATSTIVGPIIKNKETRKNYGKTNKTVNAYYAQIIFGSAIAFKRRITLAALNATKSKVVKTIDTEIKKRVKQGAKKNRLD